MSNLSIKINLTRIKGAALVNLKGNNATKQCVILPVEDCGLYVGEKGAYLDLIALAYKEPKYEQTHFVKQSIDKGIYSALTEEERGNLPIIGSVKDFVRPQMQASDTVEYADYEELPHSDIDGSDLPF